MSSSRLSIHDRLAQLADATRCRLLGALESQEMTVGELCQALQLPQSTVSRHLRILADDGWVSSRGEGSTRWYRMSNELDEESATLWNFVMQRWKESAGAAQDRARLESVLATRRVRSEEFFQSASSEWNSMRTALFGARADLAAALALLDPSMIVADLGCGTGELALALSPHVTHVHGIDASPAMLAAARARTAQLSNVSVTEGTLESLPLPDASVDTAILLLVLHHVADPERVLRETRRVLKDGGRLLIADMRAHSREEYRQQMGHVWLGFEEVELKRWLSRSGFGSMRFVPLPIDAMATGPAMFTATAYVASNATAGVRIHETEYDSKVVATYGTERKEVSKEVHTQT